MCSNLVVFIFLFFHTFCFHIFLFSHFLLSDCLFSYFLFSYFLFSVWKRVCPSRNDMNSHEQLWIAMITYQYSTFSAHYWNEEKRKYMVFSLWSLYVQTFASTKSASANMFLKLFSNSLRKLFWHLLQIVSVKLFENVVLK